MFDIRTQPELRSVLIELQKQNSCFNPEHDSITDTMRSFVYRYTLTEILKEVAYAMEWKEQRQRYDEIERRD